MLRFWLTLFISFLIIRYVLPVVLRLVLSGFVRKQMHRAQQYTQAPSGPGAPPPPTAPGEVRVDYVPPTANPARPGAAKMGDYVDFEEV